MTNHIPITQEQPPAGQPQPPYPGQSDGMATGPGGSTRAKFWEQLTDWEQSIITDRHGLTDQNVKSVHVSVEYVDGRERGYLCAGLETAFDLIGALLGSYAMKNNMSQSDYLARTTFTGNHIRTTEPEATITRIQEAERLRVLDWVGSAVTGSSIEQFKAEARAASSKRKQKERAEREKRAAELAERLAAKPVANTQDSGGYAA